MLTLYNGGSHVVNGTFRFKANALAREHDTNMHQATQKAQCAYPTLHRYVSAPAEKLVGMSMRVIFSYMVNGLGMSPDEIAARRFGDILEPIVLDEGED